MKTLSLMLVGLAPLTALAQQADLAAEADLHFALANEAFRARNYPQALDHLLQSNRLAPNRNVMFNIARTYEQLADYDAAYRYYAEYASLEPDERLRAEAEAGMARVAPRVALVRVTSEPAGAVVYVDRKDLGARGVTPLTLALPAGSHTVNLELDGHRAGAATAELVVGQEVAVRVALPRVVGQVAVAGEPAGAEVRLGAADGEVLGVLPGEISLPPGSHVLVVSAPGYRESRLPVTVEADATSRVEVALEELSGRLLVEAGQDGALIEVDGRAEGFSPEVLDLPVGAHTVRLSMPGFRPEEREVTVLADEERSVELTLRSQLELSAASRSSQRAEDAPASVSVISAAEIRAFGYQDVYDALLGTRGIYGTNDLTYAALGVRGFARTGDYGSRMLVTMDGHSTNDDQIGASYVGSDLMVDLEDVSQIEIVRGPGSALYGSNAFFGVVNVATRRDPVTPSHVRVSAGTDRAARIRARAAVGDRLRGAWFSAAALGGQGGDWYFPELAEAEGDGLIEGADGTRAATLHGRGWMGPLEIQGYWNGRSKRISTGAFDTIPGDPRAHSDDLRGFLEVRAEPKLGDVAQLFARAWVDRYRFEGDFPYEGGVMLGDRWTGTWMGVEPRLMLATTEWLDLTAGAEARVHLNASLRSFEGDETFLDEQPEQSTYSGYLVADLKPARWLRASLGGRYDYIGLEDVGGTFNPRAAIIVQPDDYNVIKLLGGTAFRAPSPYELFYNDNGQSQIRPDTLDPERIATAELEVGHRFDEVTTLTGSVFYNRILDLVDTATVPDPDGDGELLQFANTDAPVQTAGLEAELRRDWSEGSMVALQASLLRATEGSLTAGDVLTNSPWLLTSIKGATPFVVGTTVASRVRVESPRLTTFDTETAWTVVADVNLTGALMQERVAWALGVRNLLDWQVEHPTGLDLAFPSVPQPGRTFVGSVEVAF